MNVVKVQKVPQKETNWDDILAAFCYYFQQYQFHEAKKLPLQRIMQMLRVARREESKYFLQLTKITASPHTKKGKGVTTLINEYSKDIK